MKRTKQQKVTIPEEIAEMVIRHKFYVSQYKEAKKNHVSGSDETIKWVNKMRDIENTITWNLHKYVEEANI